SPPPLVAETDPQRAWTAPVKERSKAAQHRYHRASCRSIPIALRSFAVDASDIEYRILGPLEASADGRQAALGGRVQRAVLGALLLHANEAVSADRLVDAVWGSAAPPTALHAVSVYVSKLRRELGAESIARVPAGYVVRVAPGLLDLERFESLVSQARQ